MNHIDKNSLKHFSVCFLCSLFGWLGVGVAIGASVTKEWYDKQSYGHWCWWDIAFDVLGIICGVAVSHTLYMLIG